VAGYYNTTLTPYTGATVCSTKPDDGILVVEEACDDGNLNLTDGCANNQVMECW